MAGMIPRSFIDDLLVRVDIIDLIDSYVPLKKSGSSHVACCPFHTEKTPSFAVTRSKQLYHCFGCGVGGNAISFLIDYNHLNFVEAVEELADFMGLDVPKETNTHHTTQKQDNSGDILQTLTLANQFYIAQLREHSIAQAAIDYLKKRGINGKIAQQYQIGFAPDSWDNISQQFTAKQVVDAGLASEKQNKSAYDRFRGRIMFPIRDRRGRVIAFGGRVLDDSQPKYLNSPETSVFHKGREVYGLYEVLKCNPKPKQIVIVEGYLDVIALAQFGINYGVATLGTAISQAHLELLFRFSPHIIFCFDGDKAGREASWRGVLSALPSLKDGRQIKIMQLDSGVDPDDFIRQQGCEQFEQAITDAQSLSEFFFERLSLGLDLEHMEGRASLVNKAEGYLKTLPDGIFKNLMVERLQNLTNIQGLTISPQTSDKHVAAKRKQKLADSNLSPVRRAISLLLQNPKLVADINEKNINWSQLKLAGADLLQRLVEIINQHPDINLPRLIEYFRGEQEERYINIMMNHDFPLSGAALTADFIGAIERLQQQGKENCLNELIAKEKASGLDASEQQQLLTMLGDR